MNTTTSNHTSTFMEHAILSLHTTYTHIEHMQPIARHVTYNIISHICYTV